MRNLGFGPKEVRRLIVDREYPDNTLEQIFGYLDPASWQTFLHMPCGLSIHSCQLVESMGKSYSGFDDRYKILNAETTPFSDMLNRELKKYNCTARAQYAGLFDDDLGARIAPADVVFLETQLMNAPPDQRLDILKRAALFSKCWLAFGDYNWSGLADAGNPREVSNFGKYAECYLKHIGIEPHVDKMYHDLLVQLKVNYPNLQSIQGNYWPQANNQHGPKLLWLCDSFIEEAGMREEISDKLFFEAFKSQLESGIHTFRPNMMSWRLVKLY
jgi:hypothetical protein